MRIPGRRLLRWAQRRPGAVLLLSLLVYACFAVAMVLIWSSEYGTQVSLAEQIRDAILAVLGTALTVLHVACAAASIAATTVAKQAPRVAALVSLLLALPMLVFMLGGTIVLLSNLIALGINA